MPETVETAEAGERELAVTRPMSPHEREQLATALDTALITIWVKCEDAAEFELRLRARCGPKADVLKITGIVVEPIASGAPDWLRAGTRLSGNLSRQAGALGKLVQVVGE